MYQSQYSQTLNDKSYYCTHIYIFSYLCFLGDSLYLSSSFFTNLPFFLTLLSATIFLQSYEILRCQTLLAFFSRYRVNLSYRLSFRYAALLIWVLFFCKSKESFRHFLKLIFIQSASSSSSSGKAFSGKVRLNSYFCISKAKYFYAFEIKSLVIFHLLILQSLLFVRDCCAGIENVSICNSIFKKIVQKIVDSVKQFICYAD